ncbi:glucosamine--fructose-6-phosphate aminotransferase [Natrinema mahii]|nr:glucosamine--fructose-6-phosphate aminotransferase [Natrinema mahii]
MSKVVQTRVESDLQNRIEEKADQRGETVSEFVRGILENAIEADDDTTPGLKSRLRRDLDEIGATDDERGVADAIREDTWDQLSRPAFRSEVRNAMLETAGVVYVAGQGSSRSVGHWLIGRLQNHGRQAIVNAAEPLLSAPIESDDVVVLVSQSGETDACLDLAEYAADRGATVVGVTAPESSIADTSDLSVPLPSVTEHVSQYATKSLIAQVTTLQTVLFDEDPSLEQIEARLDALTAFVRDQFDDGELRDASQFKRAAAVLEEYNETALDPIVASAGTGHRYGIEAAQKFTEFLYTNPTHEHIGSVRDGALNLLFDESAYLFTILPPRDERTPTDPCAEHLFVGENAIINELLFKTNAGGSLTPRLVAIALDETDDDETDSTIEQIGHQSMYGEDGVILLSPETYVDGAVSTDDLSRSTIDLFVYGSVFLFTYALLNQRWDTDRQLRRTIIKQTYA